MDGKFYKDAEAIREFLEEYHNTEKTAVKSGEICELFSVPKERLRSIVNYLRSAEIPVCSSQRGYWYSENQEDIEKTLSHLEGRVRGINRAIKGLRKISGKKKTGRVGFRRAKRCLR